jgi:hypothetical protein
MSLREGGPGDQRGYRDGCGSWDPQDTATFVMENR